MDIEVKIGFTTVDSMIEAKKCMLIPKINSREFVDNRALESCCPRIGAISDHNNMAKFLVVDETRVNDQTTDSDIANEKSHWRYSDVVIGCWKLGHCHFHWTSSLSALMHNIVHHVNRYERKVRRSDWLNCRVRVCETFRSPCCHRVVYRAYVEKIIYVAESFGNHNIRRSDKVPCILICQF